MPFFYPTCYDAPVHSLQLLLIGREEERRETFCLLSFIWSDWLSHSVTQSLWWISFFSLCLSFFTLFVSFLSLSCCSAMVSHAKKMLWMKWLNLLCLSVCSYDFSFHAWALTFAFTSHLTFTSILVTLHLFLSLFAPYTSPLAHVTMSKYL